MDRASFEIDVHAAKLKAGDRGELFMLHAAQEGFDACQQFGRFERFGEVIVGPQFQAHDAIVELRLGGEHEDGDVVALLAEFAADFEAALAGQHDVEHDEVELFLEGLGQAGRAIGGAFDFVALCRQAGRTGSSRVRAHPPPAVCEHS